MKTRIVIVGAGMAAARLVEELTARAPERHHITLIGEEPGRPYNRVLLSSLLAQDVEHADIELKPKDWWDARGVTLIGETRVTGIDTAQHLVRLASGFSIPFDALVLATGSEPALLPLDGAGLPGVFTFRTQDDVAAMLSRAGENSRAVVIGGGLLGLEAAYGLRKTGAAVTVVHLMDRLMERQLDAQGAAVLEAALKARGIEILLKAESVAIEGEDKVRALRLACGRVLPADLIVMAAGIRPRAELARDAGLAVERGIVVDDSLRTSAPQIYALGECAEHRGMCYGLVEPAYEQAKVLASRLAGRDALAGADAAYEGSLLATNLKVSGVDVFSAGDFSSEPGAEPIVFTDPEQGTYRKLMVKNGHLTGAVLVGDTADALWYLDLIRSLAPVTAMRDGIVFGRSFCAEAA